MNEWMGEEVKRGERKGFVLDLAQFASLFLAAVPQTLRNLNFSCLLFYPQLFNNVSCFQMMS
jgi:hypothetical protein